MARFNVLGNVAYLRAGLSVEDALNAFRDGCNHGPDRLFITESWIEPRFTKLRRLLTEPITPEEAHVLRETVLKLCKLDDAIEWLEHRPMTWSEYKNLWDRRATKKLLELRARGYFPWKDVRASQKRATRSRMMTALATIFRYPAPRTYMVRGGHPKSVDEAKRLLGPRAVPCSTCGAPPEQLNWIYFVSC